jgi:hypothetical protein
VYVDISFGSVIATHLRHLLCGCCKNDDLAGFVLCLISVSGMQVIVGIFVFV